MHDVVIVGAGSAGCVLATRLVERTSARVLLLEGGPQARKRELAIPAAFSKLFRSDVDWGYDTTPQRGLDGRTLAYPRGKVVGGSSAVNAMMVLRGHRLDHTAWPEGWRWDDVAADYEVARPRLVGERQRAPSELTTAFLAAATQAGIAPREDLNEPDNDGVGLTPVSIRGGRRWSVTDGYLAAVRANPRLQIEAGAHVERIVIDDGRATGVEVREASGRLTVRSGGQVVLCAGAVGSPHLLQLSGIGAPEELAAHGIACSAEVRGVGRGLRDHLAGGVIVATRSGVRTLASAERPLPILRWLLTRRGPLASNVAEAAAFVRTDPGLAAPDVELVFAPVPFENEGLTRPTYDGYTVAAVLLQPRSVGSVTLASSDPAVPPAIDPGFLTDPDGVDLETMLDGVELARAVAHTEPLAAFADHEVLPGISAQGREALAAHVRAKSQTLYHPVGTCRMGGDGDAVVDTELRVHGVVGLRVVDASVIPALPRGHTNWVTVMVAERGARLVGAGL